jgi:hypothetical protein
VQASGRFFPARLQAAPLYPACLTSQLNGLRPVFGPNYLAAFSGNIYLANNKPATHEKKEFF